VFPSRFVKVASSIPYEILRAPLPSDKSRSSGTGVPSVGTGNEGSIPAIMMYADGNCVPVASVQLRSIERLEAVAVKLVGKLEGSGSTIISPLNTKSS